MQTPPLPTAPMRIGRRIFRSRLFETIVSPNGVDGYGAMLDRTFAVREIRAEVVNVRRQTPRSVTLTLAPNANWPGFAAGQHVGLTVEVDGVQTTRFYSPASDATDGQTLELTISLHDGGAASSYLIEHAEVGMIVGLEPPQGEFTLPSTLDRPLLLIGGGSGITPVMSLLRTLTTTGHKLPITFIHFARGEGDALYRAELKQLARRHKNLEVVHVYTREKVTGAEHGHLTLAMLKRVAPRFAKSAIYVCGPPALVDGASKLLARNAKSAPLVTESFKLPEPKIAASDATGALTFARSEVTVANDGAPLLDQAEAAGLKPRCGCRMGICHTCIAHVEEGVVRDVRSGELRTVKDEYIQTCVHAPVGEFEIEL